MGAQGRTDELVGGSGRRLEVCLVGGVEEIREGEPGTERLVIGRMKAYVPGFECCDSGE